MVRIGLRLPPGYLAGQWDATHTPALGPAPAALTELKQAGLQTVELNMMRGDVEPQVARQAMDTLAAAGLAMTVHGWLGPLPGTGDPEPTGDLVALCLHARDHGGYPPLMVTIHSLASSVEPPCIMAPQTVQAIQGWLRFFAAQRFNVQLALELNRANGAPRPGTSYTSLLEMVEEINHPGVGFCWDIGHSHWNCLHGKHPLKPPDTFTAKVIHTHIHDLGPSGATHYPLTLGNLPLMQYLNLLREARYNGILSLELSPARFTELGLDLKCGILESIAVLQAARDMPIQARP